MSDDEPTLTHRGPATAAAQRSGDLTGCRLVDRYDLISVLGRGGAGAVYKAIDLTDRSLAAVKVLDAPAASFEWRARFRQEAQAAARLSHPNTVRTLAFGETPDGLAYLVMEYVAGPTLMDVIDQEGRLSPARVVRILDQVAASLGEAHEKGLVHRDIKPANLILTALDGRPDVVKVLDFGLVKDLEADVDLTRAGVVLGSPSFMAPEQVLKQRVDARTDLYALGVVAYGALTGRAPFESPIKHELMMMQVDASVPPLAEKAPNVHFPDSLDWLVRTCLAKQREDRFADTRALRKALRAVQAELDGGAEPSGLALNAAGEPIRTTPPAPPRIALFLAGFLGLLALGSGGLCTLATLVWWWLG